MSLSSVGQPLLQLAQACMDGDAQRQTHRTIAHTLFLAVAVALGLMFGVAAIGCILAALWLAVLPHAGPAGAFVIVAGALALTSLIALMVPRLVRASPAPPPDRAVVPGTSLTDAARLLDHDKGAALLAALLIGLREGARKE